MKIFCPAPIHVESTTWITTLASTAGIVKPLVRVVNESTPSAPSAPSAPAAPVAPGICTDTWSSQVWQQSETDGSAAMRYLLQLTWRKSNELCSPENHAARRQKRRRQSFVVQLARQRVPAILPLPDIRVPLVRDQVVELRATALFHQHAKAPVPCLRAQHQIRQFAPVLLPPGHAERKQVATRIGRASANFLRALRL